MAKKIYYLAEAQKGLARGIEKLYDACKVTLGPKGRNVIIESDFGVPQIINDGVTIAKSIELSDPLENMGASLIIEAASKTNDACGDGTTTAIILASCAYLCGKDYLANGISPLELTEGLKYYLPIIEQYIQKNSKTVTSLSDIENVAAVSSGKKEVGNLIKQAYEEIGFDGDIVVEEAKGVETYLEVVKGYSYDRGFASSYMATDEAKKEAILSNAYVLIMDKKINSMKELVPYLEYVMKEGRPLLIVAEDIEQEVLSTIVLNKLRGVFNVVVTKAPSFGDRMKAYLNDLAILTKATLVKEFSESIDVATVLGEAGTIKVTTNKTLIVDGKGESEDILDYVAHLKNSLKEEVSTFEQGKIKERISKIMGGIARINVGGYTEVEVHELKLRIEDAISSTKAALEAGICEGGGKILYEASLSLPDSKYTTTKELLEKVLKAPFLQICENAGKNADEVLKNCVNGFWYDCQNDVFVKLEDAGIIDASSTQISALRNAFSIASSLYTTSVAVAKEKEKDSNYGE